MGRVRRATSASRSPPGRRVSTGSANGANGTTGETTVKPGTYSFSETQGANTNLSEYVSTYACIDQNGKAQNLPSGSYTGRST